jgi:hypothetical protein
VDAVFLGEICRISKYWAKSDRMGSWFALALNSNELQTQGKGRQFLVNGNMFTDSTQETDVHNDIAHIIHKIHAGRISQMREMEMKASHRHAEFLSFHCSTLEISQLNIQVSLGSLFHRRRV